MKFVDFTNKVCLVTGAGSPTGIGFSAAKILGGLGGRIAITATTDRINERTHRQCFFCDRACCQQSR